MSSPPLRDAVGTEHEVADPDARIVSLVPSITELLCDLGLATLLVGRTGFCIHPRETVASIAKVGGTKDVKVDRIRELAPSHVVVDVDENRRDTVEHLAAFVPNVIVTHPLVPLDNLELYRLLGGIFGREEQAERLRAEFERELARLQELQRPPRDVLYLIWRDPWMTVSRETYISATLGLVNWHTIPATATERYPTVDMESAAAAADVVLLASEPYRFREQHLPDVERLAGRTPGRADRRRDDVVVWQARRQGPALPRRVRVASPHRSIATRPCVRMGSRREQREQRHAKIVRRSASAP
jgi:ABC-type Fe3+-hydroxamate transport system substrate-binding protein